MARSAWSTPSLARLSSGQEASGKLKFLVETRILFNDDLIPDPEDDARSPS